MSNPTDLQARLVFDLGNFPENIEILEVKLEEISTVISALPGDEDYNFQFFPNPVDSNLYLFQVSEYRQALLYDLTGRKLEVFELQGTEAQINLELYPPDQYVLRMVGKESIMKSFLLLKR
jgi:hypothetical protein